MEKSKKIILAELDQRVTQALGALLKEAQPNRVRAFQLNKLLQLEEGAGNQDAIRRQILNYYQFHFERRTTGQFLRTFGVRPYPWLHNQFILNFGNANITDTCLFKLASQLRFLLLNALKPPGEIVETNFLHLTLYKLVHPRGMQPKSGLNLFDLVSVWRKTCHARWGDKYEAFFDEIAEYRGELRNVVVSRTPVTMQMFAEAPGNELELSQTDLEWMKDLLKAIEQEEILPRYPLRRGPKNPPVRQLEKIVRTLVNIKRPNSISLLRDTVKNTCVTFLNIYGQAPQNKEAA